MRQKKSLPRISSASNSKILLKMPEDSKFHRNRKLPENFCLGRMFKMPFLAACLFFPRISIFSNLSHRSVVDLAIRRSQNVCGYLPVSRFRKNLRKIKPWENFKATCKNSRGGNFDYVEPGIKIWSLKFCSWNSKH